MEATQATTQAPNSIRNSKKGSVKSKGRHPDQGETYTNKFFTLHRNKYSPHYFISKKARESGNPGVEARVPPKPKRAGRTQLLKKCEETEGQLTRQLREGVRREVSVGSALVFGMTK